MDKKKNNISQFVMRYDHSQIRLHRKICTCIENSFLKVTILKWDVYMTVILTI